MIAHCLFEQSGTFKNEFKKLGYEAYDYDILDDYGQTDFKIDLFKEIEGGYKGEKSIFDNISQDDLILAFFPCVRFENQIMLSFRGQNHGMEKWTIADKMKYDMKLMEEVKHNYDLVNKLFLICYERNLQIVMENPYSKEHFLHRYWCLKPEVIDMDRRKNGDFMKKPTQYWFMNCKAKNNVLFESTEWNAVEIQKDAIRLLDRKTADQMGAATIKQARSTIHPQYANRFIRQFLIEQ